MIYTSYFGNVGNLFRMGFSKEDLVGISVYKCKWLEDIQYCKELMVKKTWLWDLKNNLIEWEDYKKLYINNLYNQDIHFWWDFEKNFDGKVLLCFEKNYHECHRSLVGLFCKWYFFKDMVEEI